MHLTHNERKKINETTPLKAALMYANHGIPVIPLRVNDKKPLIEGGKQFENASTEEWQIRNWWKNCPNANIGIKPPPGYIVLDFDDHKCNDEQKKILDTYRSIPTQSQKTAHNGEHRIYRTNQLYSSQTNITGLDTRQSHTGYIVAAPSKVDGGKYEWTYEDGGISEYDPPNLKTQKPPSTNKTLNFAPGKFKKRIKEISETKEGNRHQKLLDTAIFMAAHNANDQDFEELLQASISTNYPENDARRDINDARTHITQKMKNIPSVTGIQLFNLMNEYFNKYMWFDDDRCAQIITLWVLHCFYIKSFEITPRLYITASSYGAGKTRLIQCIETLMPSPENSIYTSSITQAALYNLIDQHIDTPIPIFIDEWDAIPKNSPMYEALRSVINSGWQPNGVVYRTHDKKSIPSYTFAPIALIGKTEEENESILQRSLIIKLTKKISKEKLPNLRKKLFKNEAEQLRNIILKYVYENPITTQFMEELEEPEEINNRNADLWEPLRAVAKNLDTKIYNQLPSLYPFTTEAIRDLRGEDEEAILLEDIERIFQEKYLPRKQYCIFSGDLALDLEQMVNSRWKMGNIGITQKEIASKLKRFGITPRLLKINERVARGYKRDKKFIKALRENQEQVEEDNYPIPDYSGEVETFLKNISEN